MPLKSILRGGLCVENQRKMKNNIKLPKKEAQPQIKAEILKVNMWKDEITDKKLIEWDYPVKTNCYFLIGVLETIKQELLEEINERGDDFIELK